MFSFGIGLPNLATYTYYYYSPFMEFCLLKAHVLHNMITSSTTSKLQNSITTNARNRIYQTSIISKQNSWSAAFLRFALKAPM